MRSGGSLPWTRSRPDRAEARGMRVRLRTSTIVLVAVTMLATAWAHAAEVRPAAHNYVKGELFRYTTVLTLGLGDDPGVSGDGPHTMSTVAEVRVVGVSPFGATLAYRVVDHKVAYASDVTATFRASGDGTLRFRASRDGTWRYSNGRITESFVTWDPVLLGAQPGVLIAGQHWVVNVPRRASSEASHAVVRAVSVGLNKLTLHVESAPPLSSSGAPRGKNGWYADVAFEDGIVRELHRYAVQRTGPGAGGVDARFDSRVRLLTHTTPYACACSRETPAALHRG